jgi:nucleoside-diphosphate-sugar epimerase
MRVFVTGATGFVGTVVVQDLIRGGHQVLGLSRSDAGAAALIAAGAEVHRGSLEDVDSLRAGAAAAEGVIHLAFNHDFSRYEANCEEDYQVILAMADVLKGSGRPMLVTAGAALARNGDLATEADEPPPHFPRRTEAAAAEARAIGARVGIVRLPPSTHGRGDKGFANILIETARAKGFAAYVGDGGNRWPAVHRLDAAKVYRLALEHGAEGGPFHAIGEEGVRLKDIAETIGRGLNLPVRSITPEEAADYYGWFAMIAAIDAPTSAARTKALLGWTPTDVGLIGDMEAGYFAA